jgi:hypothetical protein
MGVERARIGERRANTAVPASSMLSPTAVTVGATFSTVTVARSSSLSAVAAVTSPPMSFTVNVMLSTASSMPP